MNKPRIIGVDLAKHSFALVILDSAGKVLVRKMLKRRQLLAFLAKQDVAIVAMEACTASYYWAREIQALGHQVMLLPPQHVKGYLRGQKNDYNDALAIAEACLHNRIRPVPIKTLDQQDEQCFQTIRNSLIKDKIRLSSQLRGLLEEYGLVVAKGDAALRRAMTDYLDNTNKSLTLRARTCLARQYERFVAVLEELEWYDTELRHRVKQDEVCSRMLMIPGFGPVVSSVVKHWMGDGNQFSCGRDASAALGLVPRQYSTGGKERLGSISKRGDPQVRSLIIHGARAVVSRADKKDDALSCWIQRVKARRGFNKAVVALANKLIRIAWVLIARGETYQARG